MPPKCKTCGAWLYTYVEMVKHVERHCAEAEQKYLRAAPGPEADGGSDVEAR